jgi:hypothetical protein
MPAGNKAFVPGWTINEFPAFANTRTLVVMPRDTLRKKNILKIPNLLSHLPYPIVSIVIPHGVEGLKKK